MSQLRLITEWDYLIYSQHFGALCHILVNGLVNESVVSFIQDWRHRCTIQFQRIYFFNQRHCNKTSSTWNTQVYHKSVIGMCHRQHGTHSCTIKMSLACAIISAVDKAFSGRLDIQKWIASCHSSHLKTAYAKQIVLFFTNHAWQKSIRENTYLTKIKLEGAASLRVSCCSHGYTGWP